MGFSRNYKPGKPILFSRASFIMKSSKYPPAKRSPITIPISIAVGLINGIRLVFFDIALINMKLLDVAIEYAVSSMIPNGERKRIVSGGIFANSGETETIAEKANPVDHAENNPHTTPNPGINIGNDTDEL